MRVKIRADYDEHKGRYGYRRISEALSQTRCDTELIVRLDQGWHYKMQPYRAMLARHGVKQSMSRKRNRFDNAAIDSFFGTLKAEYFHLAAPSSIDNARSRRA
ncbi:DDE-type integrase/transposase/recombinase [Pandoraea sp. B-6]|uniref:DDE-type integrase/transposase/recombinase n=1 Tax=Pandoraea sp. B-6 TaxID=1204340 RepID=UPI00034D91C5|nr:DDE-type integrase/transposase/recombinase [Pandoraea sp. B-6]